MISMAAWRTYTALALLIFMSIGLIAGCFLPVVISAQGPLTLWGLFVIHPILGIVGMVVLTDLIMLGAANLVRLLNLNVNAILMRNTPLTPIVSLLGLGYNDLETDTTRLNQVLTGLLLGALLVLGGLTQVINLDVYTADGYGALLFFAAVPMSVIALACHPRLCADIVRRVPTMNARMYFEVRRGRLIGAKPQIDLPPVKMSDVAAPTTTLSYGQPGLFSIGRSEMNDLVLFDENPHEVLDTHACLFFPDFKPTLRIYGPVRINDEMYETPDDYALEDQFKFQIGQTIIRFLIEPQS